MSVSIWVIKYRIKGHKLSDDFTAIADSKEEAMEQFNKFIEEKKLNIIKSEVIIVKVR